MSFNFSGGWFLDLTSFEAWLQQIGVAFVSCLLSATWQVCFMVYFPSNVVYVVVH